MVHVIRFQNVLSYKEAEVDFYTSTKQENSLLSAFTRGLSPLAAIFGNNASGKSNFIEALAIFKRLVIDSFKEGKLYYFPHLMLHNKDSLFEIIIEVDGHLYHYYLRYNQKSVIKESLSIRKPKKRFRRIFLREGKRLKIGDKFKHSFPLKKEEVDPSYLALPYLYHSGFKPVNPIYNFFQDMIIYLPGKGETTPLFEKALIQIQKGPPELIQFTRRILEMADIGIKDFLMSQERKAFRGIEFIHTFSEEQKIPLSFYEESTGTVILFLLSPHFYQVLRKGSLMALDQIDGNIHPWTWEKILNLFRSPAKNVSQAQLLFSTHCPSVMDSLQKEELWLVEKRQGFSEIYSAKDFVDLKKSADLRRLYLSGKLGAVPGG